MRARFSRRQIAGAARVAGLATLLMALSYAGVVAVLDGLVAVHLTGQVDRQLTARLEVAATSPRRAFATTGVQSQKGRYGLGIYGEPIDLWAFTPAGALERSAPGDPALPRRIRPPRRGAPRSENEGIDGATYRVEWVRASGSWLLAAESLSELGHVEAVLVVSEAVAFPFLMAAFFLVALAIGLRSARPVETARRRLLEFTADASHELRTPLSVIEAEVSLIRSKPRAPAEYEASLDRVRDETGRLQVIVEDLLWLARLDSEPEPPETVPTDLVAVVRESSRRFSPLAEGRRQQIEVSTADLPLVVTAPPGWLDKLTGTLVDNACRYSGDGGHIRLSALGNGSGRIVLRVEDDGPGVPPHERSEVTRRFHRATGGRGGHGLGLAIADSITTATGGRLEVGESPLGGALVEVSWPQQPDEENPTKRSSTSSSTPVR